MLIHTKTELMWSDWVVPTGAVAGSWGATDSGGRRRRLVVVAGTVVEGRVVDVRGRVVAGAGAGVFGGSVVGGSVTGGCVTGGWVTGGWVTGGWVVICADAGAADQSMTTRSSTQPRFTMTPAVPR